MRDKYRDLYFLTCRKVQEKNCQNAMVSKSVMFHSDSVILGNNHCTLAQLLILLLYWSELEAGCRDSVCNIEAVTHDFKSI